MQKVKFTKIIISVMAVGLVFTSCNSQQTFNQKLVKAIEDEPTILSNAIENNPTLFLTSFQKAAEMARKEMANKRSELERTKLESAYSKPLKSLIRKDEAIRGPKDAPITIVEYSDFECPFCSRSYETLKALSSDYEGKIRVVYKHLPLSFHPQAMLASRYYEALRVQSEKKAFQFHDELFEKQGLIKKGDVFFKKVAKSLGANMKRLSVDVKSEKLLDRIKEDIEEAKSFGIQGTPGFLVNGIPIKGAQPKSSFIQVIEELRKRKMLKL